MGWQSTVRQAVKGPITFADAVGSIPVEPDTWADCRRREFTPSAVTERLQSGYR